MTRLEALRALAEKVEAGDASYYPGQDFHLAMDGNKYEFLGRTKGALECDRAYKGSLNAAKALHETALPGWEHGMDSSSMVWVKMPGLRSSYRSRYGSNPARAWLLAILKALIAREQAKGDE